MLYWNSPLVTLHHADARSLPMPDESVDCVVTSPPYWGLRDYQTEKQIGLEPTPEEYCANMVEVFREVWRVLKPTGTVWLNLGDCYSEKDLVGIPWRVAFALQADGWYLRSDIIWSKPNPMPESVTDRPTKAHEYIFLLTKSPRYYYDGDAIREQSTERPSFNRARLNNHQNERTHFGINIPYEPDGTGRNKRSVWEITTQPYPEAHFATFPEALVKPCILAGTSEKGVCAECGDPWERIVEKDCTFESGSGRSGISPHGKNGYGLQGRGETLDIRRGPVVTVSTIGWEPTCTCKAKIVPATILDPFVGSGTTMAVAQKLGRRGVGVDLSLEYLELAQKRLREIPLPMPLWA